MGGGKNTTVKRIKESINRGIEYFCNVEIGVFRIISPATKPAQINRLIRHLSCSHVWIQSHRQIYFIL